jgi:hypothetical protein
LFQPLRVLGTGSGRAVARRENASDIDGAIPVARGVDCEAVAKPEFAVYL